jgi:hypothetical protein
MADFLEITIDNWLAVVRAALWQADRAHLRDPQSLLRSD